MSGGERQRLALARGLLRQPALLVLDEVTSALDPENEAKIRDSIARLVGQMTIVILVLKHAFLDIADKVLHMNDGKISPRNRTQSTMIKTCKLNDAILAMLVPNPARDVTEIVAELDAEDWLYVLDRGREHRFLPLLHHGLAQAQALESVPPDVTQNLAEVRRQHTLRALTAQRELLLVHRLLKAADIEHVFLKGAYLAQFAYPHAALRPMRDIDVVVRPTQIARAHQLMIEAGYCPWIEAEGMLEAYVGQDKHLPPLRTPSRKYSIELHVHVDRPGGILAGMDAFAHVTNRQVASETVPFMGLTDLLVHLCVHAVSFHSFNNGPLTIADIGFLLNSGQVNAGEIAARAAELGVTKSVALTLALTESCWGMRRNDLQMAFDPVPQEFVQTARQMCFTSVKQQKNITFFVGVAGQNSRWQSLQLLARKLVPSAQNLALEFGKPRNAVQLGRFHIKRWQRILTERLPALHRGSSTPDFRQDYNRAVALQKWLQ